MILITTIFCYENVLFQRIKKPNQTQNYPLHLFTTHNIGFRQLSHTPVPRTLQKERTSLRKISFAHLPLQHLKGKPENKLYL